METFKIRRPVAYEAIALVDLVHEHLAQIGLKPEREYLEVVVMNFVQGNDNLAVAVVDTEAGIQGYIFMVKAKHPFLGDFLVGQELGLYSKVKGSGKALINWFEEWCHDCKILALSSEEAGINLDKYYTRLGYTKQETTYVKRK